MPALFLPVLVLARVGPASAEAAATSADPAFTIAFRETADVWRNVSGGLGVGYTSLNKAQLSATWWADRFGDPGLRVHAQVFRTNGERLTSRTGDLQTVSNIEALSTNRLMEAWVEQGFGKPDHGGAVRVGLIDLNTNFDGIDPAALFIDSSHGIGPDLSKSGRNGPSIFPVSAFGAELTMTPSDRWTVRGGVFDGVPGDPGDPKAFAAVRLSASDGVLAIVQADRKLGKSAQLSLGAWGYSTALPAISGGPDRTDRGVYGYLSGAVPGLEGVTGWVRAGWAAPEVQVVSGYLGAGLVKAEPLLGRKDDRLGLAVSHAVISGPARRARGLADAETTIEATYQLQVTEQLALQPDVQYVVHPSSRAGLHDALAFGLRVIFTAKSRRRGASGQGNDPTLPPDI